MEHVTISNPKSQGEKHINHKARDFFIKEMSPPQHIAMHLSVWNVTYSSKNYSVVIPNRGATRNIIMAIPGIRIPQLDFSYFTHGQVDSQFSIKIQVCFIWKPFTISHI